jgi:integrase
MARVIDKLTAAGVARISKPGKHGDGRGLYLLVERRNGVLHKRWSFQFKMNGAPWPQEMGLGRLADVSLAKAREKTNAARHLILDGINPIDDKRRRKAEAKAEALELKAEILKRVSFKEAAGRFFAAKPKDDQWARSLAALVYPHLADLPVSSIDTPHIEAVLRPIWSKNVTARRVRGRIESILDFATISGWRSGENPARWKGHLEHILAASKPEIEHHTALPYAAMPGLMKRVRSSEGVAARAMEMLTLTGVRAGECLGMRWEEVDLEGKLWTVPASRMKGGIEHRIPLSRRAVEILKGQGPQAEGLVFPSPRDGKVMKADLPRRLLHRLVGSTEQASVHGLRSTFRDWAAERTRFAHEVCEAALAHLTANAVSRSYRRTDFLDERVKLMQMWCNYCQSPVEPIVEDDEKKVVTLRRKA